MTYENITNLPFLIATDSGCDLSIDTCKKYNIIPCFMEYTDGSTTYTDNMINSETIKMYNNMKEGATYKTCAININKAYEFLNSLLKYNKDIIFISLGSAISSSYNNFQVALKMLKNDINSLPRITIIDSTVASVAYGMLAIEASIMRSEDKSYDEVITYLNNEKTRINTYYTTSDLTYLAKGGRVTKIASIFAKVLSVKPILKLDLSGKLLITTKAHGQNNCLSVIKKLIRSNVLDPSNQTLYVSHSNNINDAIKFAEDIRNEFGFKDIMYTYIGPIIGTHTGPGLISFFYHGKERE